jgi:hypothetical protein
MWAPALGVSTCCCRPARPQGYLFPSFHENYWIGLHSAAFPIFTWVDKLIPGPTANSYKNWGTFMSGTPLAKPEPKNRDHQCAVANATQAYGSRTVRPWGWASQDCSAHHVYMCRISSRWRGHGAELRCQGARRRLLACG